MGSKRRFTCRACGYETISSGGPDAGRRARTDTFVCERCEILLDCVIGTRVGLETTPKEPMCHACNGRVKRWDSEKKACPKCQSPMSGSSFPIMHWGTWLVFSNRLKVENF